MDEPSPEGPGEPGQSEWETLLQGLFRDSHTNAIIAWLLVGVLAAVFLESLADRDVLWILFVGTVGLIVLIPPVSFRGWRVMLPWELLVLALLPILVRGLFGGTLGTFAVYLSVAGLALIVVVELHMFSPLRLTHWFAIVLVVLTTTASVAGWTIIRWNLDRFLGTSYLTTNEALMVEWLWVILAGIVAGVLFDSYFRRRDRVLRRAIRRGIRR